MTTTNYTFTNETLTAVLREGYYVWVATKPASGYAKLYKLSVFDPNTIYYTITTSFTEITSLSSDTEYVYVVGNCETYLIARYYKTAPSTYDYLATPGGFLGTEIKQVKAFDDWGEIVLLYAGDSGEQDCTVIMVNQTDFEVDEVAELVTPDSNPILLEGVGLMCDVDSSVVWIFANLSGTANLISYDGVSSELFDLSETAYGLISESINDSVLDVNDTSDVLIYAVTELAKVAVFDVTIPAVPTVTVYDYSSTNNTSFTKVIFNTTNDKLYLLSEPNNDWVYTLDTTVLDESAGQLVDLVDVGEEFFALDNFSSLGLTYLMGLNDLIVLDERSNKIIETEIRTGENIEDVVNTNFAYTSAKKINSDFRTMGIDRKIMLTDFRYKEATPILPGVDSFSVLINGVDTGVKDVQLDTIRIDWNNEAPSTASFILARYHDKPNYTLDNVASQITNKNAVVISFNGTELFTGKINGIKPSYDQEHIEVNCKGTIRPQWLGTVNLPLPSVNETFDLQAHIQHFETSVEQEVTDYDKTTTITVTDSETGESREETVHEDVSEEDYKGVKINLGTQIEEQYEVSDTWQPLISDDYVDVSGLLPLYSAWKPIPNYDYFWKIDYHHAIYVTTGEELYIGKNNNATNQISADLWVVDKHQYLKQRKYDNVETELGWYYLGDAPYKEVSAKNGRYIAKPHWEDLEDGLYWVTGRNWDFVEWAKGQAKIEYALMLANSRTRGYQSAVEGESTRIYGQNFNTAGIRTSATIVLSLHALLYHGVKNLTNINITNTTESGIYTNQNGFPLSVKTVSIASDTLLVTIGCDNTLSDEEKDRVVDQAYAELKVNTGEEPVETEEYTLKILQKYDINRGCDVV